MVTSFTTPPCIVLFSSPEIITKSKGKPGVLESLVADKFSLFKGISFTLGTIVTFAPENKKKGQKEEIQQKLAQQNKFYI